MVMNGKGKKRKVISHANTLLVHPVPPSLTRRIFNFSKHEDQVSWLVIQRRAITAMGCVDWSEFATLGWDVPLTEVLDKGGLTPLFQVTEPAYEWPTKELLCTFKYTPKTDPNDWTSISFSLGGKARHCSLNFFGVALGFYTLAELEKGPPLVVFPGPDSEREKDAFWRSIAPSASASHRKNYQRYYDPSSSKASLIERPIYRFLHMLFRDSITHRVSSGGVCNARDLFMILHTDREERVHLGALVALLFQYQRTGKESDLLCGGSYVTRLAAHYECLEKFGNIDTQPKVAQFLISSDVPRSKGVPDIFANKCPPLYPREPAPLCLLAANQQADTSESTPSTSDTSSLTGALSQFIESQQQWQTTFVQSFTNFQTAQQQQWTTMREWRDSVDARLDQLRTSQEEQWTTMQGWHADFDTRLTRMEDAQRRHFQDGSSDAP